ncbi:MAG: isoleucine--tRNA ligase [Bacteroidales bacterium]|nr:isoleucine--tRNA ligase [Bacteroidales bacterium]
MLYNEYDELNLPKTAQEILEFWRINNIFQKSISSREGHPAFVFYEGPPSANGKPGIHHVMSRTIKDLFCRYKTLKGYQVQRKAGWDTHGLPVEIGVEKKLGISKEDIGKKISIEDFNKECRKDVMQYKQLWDELTVKMGFWIDLDHPYITFDNKYIESVWYLLKQLYEKGLLYKGYTIQPYSPAAGTGLSTHELNQPGCYRLVKDYSVVAQFKVIRNERSEFLFSLPDQEGNVYILAWTTTPWTLPSNTGLAVGVDITYVAVQTYNPFTLQPQTVILAKETLFRWFKPEEETTNLSKPENPKHISFKVLGEFKGKDLVEIRYEQLLPYAKPQEGDPFRVVPGDFVTIEEGTGIVHIAPSFGADDFRMDKLFKLGALTLVDKQGKFTEEMQELAGKFVKPQYYPDYTPEKERELSVDVEIINKLKRENKAFRTEKYEHNYPHCWRTDKPVLYYPLHSWFIRTTAYKDRMIELNKTIQWKPEHTGSGRFGNWLENIVDWNLSRTRYWGIPLPIWSTTDGTERKCMGSIAELYQEIEKSIEAGFMKFNPLREFALDDLSDENYQKIDLHRPYVDQIILTSSKGEPMYRESEVIDVWFDSGAMPYAQWHYPFENKEIFERNFPADFIAEGVDQTRGWFYTLHAIATMISDSVAFKTVVSNGLVLDKFGNKMSKRLGNVIDPFETIDRYGPDATRWYMITNSQPWENLKFDVEGILEVQRKFFGTLYNTYAFFALYANIDGFKYEEPEVPIDQRTELDRWILSELNTLIQKVDESYAQYEPTQAGRLIEHFVIEYLSNWYVRLSRRRFWKGAMTIDKLAAYQTLYTTLETVAILMSPIAPFFAERLYQDLNSVTRKNPAESVHLAMFPKVNLSFIDKDLEERMQLAQKLASMILSLRKKVGHRVRQPLRKVLIPLNDDRLKKQIEHVKDIILHEVNVKELLIIDEDTSLVIKKAKPNFKQLGPRFGKMMKELTPIIQALTNEQILQLEKEGKLDLSIQGQVVTITPEDVEVFAEDIPGWVVQREDNMVVALDTEITEDLYLEGLARDVVNRIQNLRKENDFEVTDRIVVYIKKSDIIQRVMQNFSSYICSETLTDQIELCEEMPENSLVTEIGDNIPFVVFIRKS